MGIAPGSSVMIAQMRAGTNKTPFWGFFVVLTPTATFYRINEWN